MPTPEEIKSTLNPIIYSNQLSDPAESYKDDMPETIPYTDMYDYAGEKFGFVSRYPRYSPDFDLEHYYGTRQKWTNKLGNSLKTFGALFGNTYVNHFKSYGRQLDALTDWDLSKMWDDEYGERSAETIRAVQNLNPIYETRQARARREKEGGAWTALSQYFPGVSGAGNAWANLLGQAGFTGGTIGAVLTENVALGLASGGFANLAKAPTSIRAILKSFYQLGKTTDYLRDARYANRTLRSAKSFSEGFKIAANNPALRGSFTAYRMFTAAHGEAAIEANMSALEFREDQIEKYVEKNGFYPPDEVLEEIEKRAIKVGNATHNWNFPVLMASNYAVFGNLFTKTSLMPTIAKSAKKGFDRTVLGKGKESIKKTFKPFLEKNMGPYAKGLSKAKNYVATAGKFMGTESIGEGLEELMQGVGSRAAQHTFDMQNDDAGNSMLAFIETATGNELAKSLGTREGWDEFFAGFFTGGGIKAFGSIARKAYGRTAFGTKEKTLEQMGAIEATSALKWLNPLMNIKSTNQTSDLLKQFYAAFGSVNAIDENNIDEAENFQAQAEAEFYGSVLKYDKLDETLDLYQDILKAIEQENPDIIKENLGDGDNVIENRIAELRENGKKWEKDWNMMRGLVGENPNPPDSNPLSPYKIWEQAFNYAVSFGTIAKNDMKKVEEIAERLKANGVNERIVSAIADSSIRQEQINQQQELVDTQKNTLKLKEEKDITQSEREQLKKDEAILNALKAVEENKNEKDLAKEVLSEIDVETLPSEIVNDMNNLYRIEKERAGFTHTFNLLQNKDYFNKYALAFKDTYLKLETAFRKMPDGPVYEGGESDLVVGDEVGITQAELNRIISKGLGVGRLTAVTQALRDLKDKLGEREENIQETPDGKFIYNNNQYESKNQIYDEIINELEESDRFLLQENIEGQTLTKAVKLRWINSVNKAIERLEAEISQGAPTQQETPPHPETREEADKKSQRQPSSSGTPNQSKLHNFTNAVSFIWRKLSDTQATITDLRDYLETTLGVTGRQTRRAVTAQKNIQDAIVKIEQTGAEPIVISIHGVTEEKFTNTVGGEGVLENLANTNQIYAYHDGGRQFLIFADPGTGEITNFLKERLNGLTVNERGGYGKVRYPNPERDDVLLTLTADFEMSQEFSKDDILKAIQMLRPNQSLLVRVADTEHNAKTVEDYKNDLIKDKKTFLYLLDFEFVILDRATNNLLSVGKLKSAFALIQSETANNTNRVFRDQMGEYLKDQISDKENLSLENLIESDRAMVKYVSTETTPNIGITQDGMDMVWSNVREYEDYLPDNWAIDDYYYAVSGTDLRSSRTPEVSERLDKFNRGLDFRKGAVYLRLVNRETGDSHTTQLYAETSGRTGDIVLLDFEDFKSNNENRRVRYIDNSAVNLEMGESPISSRRITIDLELSPFELEKITAESIEYNEESIINNFNAIAHYETTYAGNTIQLRDVEISWGKQSRTILIGAVLNQDSRTIQGYLFDQTTNRLSDELTQIPLSEIENIRKTDPLHKKFVGLQDSEIKQIEKDIKNIIDDKYKDKENENLIQRAEALSENGKQNHIDEQGNYNEKSHRESLIKKVYFRIHTDRLQNPPKAIKELSNAILQVFNPKVKEDEDVRKYIPTERLELILLYFESERAKILQEDANLLAPALPTDWDISLLNTEEDRRTWLFFKGPETVQETNIRGFAVSPLGDYQETYTIVSYQGDTIDNRTVKVSRTRQFGPQGPFVTTQETYYWDGQKVQVVERIIDEAVEVTMFGGVISDLSANQIAYRIFDDNKPLSYSQYIALEKQENRDKVLQALEKIKKVYEHKIKQDPVKEVKQLLTMMGLGIGRQGKTAETFFTLMIKAYHRSVFSGRPYKSLNDLLDNMEGITDGDRAIFNDAVSNAFLGLAVWEFITQADGVFNIGDSEQLRKNLTTIQESVTQLRQTTQAITEDNKSEETARSFRQEIIDELSKITKKIGLAILDKDSLLYTSLEKFKDFVNKILDTLSTVNPIEYGKRLARLPVEIALNKASVAIDNKIQTMKVNALSRGRNPMFADHKDGIYLDIAMYREGEGRNLIVRNENDGFFIEMRRPREKATQDVLDLQQKFLDSLQVTVSQEYLMAYKKVNGNFNTLVQRIDSELMRQQKNVPNSWGYTTYENMRDMKDMAVDRDNFVISEKNGLVTAKTNDIYIKIGGKLYRNVFDIKKNKSIFVRDDKQLNTLRINEMLRRAGVKPDMIFERDRIVSKKISNLEAIKKQIDKMRCK